MRHTQQGLFKFNEYYCDMEVNGEIFKDTQITFPLTETGIKEGDYCYAACVRLKTSEPFFLQNFKELV